MQESNHCFDVGTASCSEASKVCGLLILYSVAVSDEAMPTSFMIDSRCESGERRVDVVELSDFAMIYKKPLDFFVNFQFEPESISDTPH
ncbi:MAG: hypothetical protein V7L29_28930 [Nostoc sp.]|uniref:hypothetical protein n=1 Tax=Nostoc sp. TaxID=1180 RepID=UPI002FF61156